MKFNDLTDTLREEIISLNEENIHEFFSKNRDINSLYGNVVYNYINDSGDYYLLGENRHFSSLQKMVKFINERYNDMIDVPLNEELAYAKFRYRSKYPNKGYQIHDKKPKVIVLDNDYCWTKGKKNPNRHDILAFNLNYSDQAKIDRKAIDEITTFAYMIKKNDKDVYERIKKFYPEAIKYIRCYKPNQMTKLKKKDGWFWKACSVADLAPTDKDFAI